MFGYSEKKLAKDIMRIAARLDPELSGRYAADTLTVSFFRSSDPDTTSHSVFLGNLYNKVKDMKSRDREDALQRFMSDALNPRELSSDELIASLALRTRSPFELNLRRQILKAHGDIPEGVCFGSGELLLELVSDGAESISTISQDDLAAHGISTEEAYKTAVATLNRATDHDQWIVADRDIWVSTYQDDYDFARLIVAGEHAKLPFDGPVVLFSPSHSVCLVTNKPDADTLTRMIGIGEQLAESHRAFSQFLWTRTGDHRWDRWMPAANDAGAKTAELQAARELLSQYTDQKDILDGQLEAREEDSFVASLSIYDRPEGLRSFCTYTLNLPSYLPEADQVAIVDPDGSEETALLGTLPWDRFVSLLGDTLKPMPEWLPARFDLTAPLSGDLESALRNQAEPM